MHIICYQLIQLIKIVTKLLRLYHNRKNIPISFVIDKVKINKPKLEVLVTVEILNFNILCDTAKGLFVNYLTLLRGGGGGVPFPNLRRDLLS